MNQDRISQLRLFLKEDPNDPFTKYALALEYLKIDKKESRKMFEELLKKHPDYVGTYYHAAALYDELDERILAEETYKKGIEVASVKGDHHALRELKTAYMNFQFDD